MKSFRTTGLFLLACSGLCFIIAVERYMTAVRTGEAIAAAMKGVEFETVSMPIETKVCGLVGIALLVAGVRVLFESVGKSNKDDGMLKPE